MPGINGIRAEDGAGPLDVGGRHPLSKSLETRLAELRSNKTAVDKVLDYQLGDFLCEILHSPGPLELCVGLFEVLSPAFCAAIEHYLAETQPLVDFPTVRLLKSILAEERERAVLGREFVDLLRQQEDGEESARAWRRHFEGFLGGRAWRVGS